MLTRPMAEDSKQEDVDSPGTLARDRDTHSVNEGAGIHSDDYPPMDIPERKVVSSTGFSSMREPGSAAVAEEDEEDEEHESRPLTGGSRIPSQLSRARLARTPVSGPNSRPLTADPDQFSATEEVDAGTPDVLITELKDEEVAVLNWDDQPSAEQEADEEEYVDEEMQWDTDLEIEEEREEEDLTGRSAYVKVCERMGVVPVSYFMRHIGDPELVMRYHGLGPQGTKAIASILKDNITVERVNLSGNDLCSEGGVYMAKMLQENDFISEVSLADNNLGSAGGYHMAKMLMVNSGLRKVDLKGNNFEDKDAHPFAEAIENNKFLRELVLSHNRFGEEAGEELGPVISSNDILDHLDLSWNHIRRKGAVAVANGVKENVRLKTCNLSWNGLGPEGGAAIAEAIRGNSSLLELDISGNRIDATSCALIAKSLQVNDELRVLKMGNNPITTAGAIALVSAINENDSSVLAFLDLTDIPVEYEFLCIVEELQKKRSFRVLHGPTIRSGNTSEDLGKPGIDPYARTDPLLILREHIVVNDMRIIDIFRRYDEDGTLTVTVQQFAAALEELQVPFSTDQLEDISKKLDRDNSGRIYYGDFLKENGSTDQTSVGADQTSIVENGINHSSPSPSPPAKRPTPDKQNITTSQTENTMNGVILENKTTQTGSGKQRTDISIATPQGSSPAVSPKTGKESVATLSYTKQNSVEQ